MNKCFYSEITLVIVKNVVHLTFKKIYKFHITYKKYFNQAERFYLGLVIIVLFIYVVCFEI